MTTQEFNTEFDLLYSNNANVGPGLDSYDKSVFLTLAQEEIVNNYYSAKSNRKREGFEETEKRRRDLYKISVPATATTPFRDVTNISPNSYYFIINDDVKLIVNERLQVSSSDVCLNNKVLSVVPYTHDEYNIQKDNPFKRPDKDEAWRLDISHASQNVVEIVVDSQMVPLQYYYRYVKIPKPIILEDLTGGLSINGETDQTECELQLIAREILNRAVELALEASSNPRFQSKIQLNTRNE